MKSVLFSINTPHTGNILCGIKTIELRLKPPKIDEPYKGYIYETKKNGGCGKVVGEFIAYNENTYRVCMGVPKHLLLEGCVSTYDILKYTNNGEKDITAISIIDVIRYAEPKELNEFYSASYQKNCGSCITICESYPHCVRKKDRKVMTRPPQSYCYVEKLEKE